MISAQYRTLLLLVLLIGLARAEAQLQALPGLPLTLSGSVSAGYAGGTGAASIGQPTTSNSATFGATADLGGTYYDPRFLQFDIAPRFTWSRDSSDAASALQNRNDGVNASVQFLQGSVIPVHLSYELTQTNSATLSGGTIPFTVSGEGVAQSFSVSTSTRFRKLPSIGISFSQSESDTNVTGVTAPTEHVGNDFLNMYSSYRLLGFVISGDYSHSTSHSETQDLLNLGIPAAPSEASSNAESFTLTRNILLHGSAGLSYSYNEDTYSIGGPPQNDSYNTASANIALLPVPRLSWNADANYTSNATDELISEATTGQTTSSSSTVLGTGRTLTVETNAAYQMGRSFTAGGTGGHVSSTIAGENLVSNLGAGVLTYALKAWNGLLTMSYSPGWNSLDVTEEGQSDVSSGMNNAVTASYLHRVGTWVAHGSVSVARNNAYESNIVPEVASSFSANGNARTRLRYTWDLMTTATVTKNQAVGSNGTLSELFSAQLSNRKWSVNGQFQRNSGYSFFAESPTVSSASSPGIQTLYNTSQSYSLAGTYHRGLFSTQVSYSYTNGTYDTATTPTTTANSYLQAIAYYKFRALDLQAGYRRIAQTASSNNALDSVSNGYWMSVIRQFRLF